jgi:hypothetical protein
VLPVTGRKLEKPGAPLATDGNLALAVVEVLRSGWG